MNMSKKTLWLSLLGLVALIALAFGSGLISFTTITIQNTWKVDCDQSDVYACTGKVGAVENGNLYKINPMINGSYHQRLFDSLGNNEKHTCFSIKSLSETAQYRAIGDYTDSVYYTFWCN